MIDHARELRAWAANDSDTERAMMMRMAASEIDRLRVAIFDLVNMECTQMPDMSGKRRTFAYIRNGTVLADCLDRARALLPYDMQPTDPHHGGKIPLE